MMLKDFDSWNEVKKKIHNREVKLFCNPREIWWSSIGLNVGSEEDGKNELFERPVLIVKVFNVDMVRAIPLTSKTKNDKNHIVIKYQGRDGSVILSQMKTISTKRLSRKLCRLGKGQFNKIVRKLSANLI